MTTIPSPKQNLAMYAEFVCNFHQYYSFPKLPHFAHTSTVYHTQMISYSFPIYSVKPTFPPKTSSPIIRHAAVCIVLELRSSAVDDDVMILWDELAIAAAEL